MGHNGWIAALTLLPNGLLASGSGDCRIIVWNITKTYPLYTLIGHANDVRALVLVNDQYLASGSLDKTIKLWSLKSYSNVKTWTASTSYVSCLAYDSTLNLLASGDNEFLVKVWDPSFWTNISNTGIII